MSSDQCHGRQFPRNVGLSYRAVMRRTPPDRRGWCGTITPEEPLVCTTRRWRGVGSKFQFRASHATVSTCVGGADVRRCGVIRDPRRRDRASRSIGPAPWIASRFGTRERPLPARLARCPASPRRSLTEPTAGTQPDVRALLLDLYVLVGWKRAHPHIGDRVLGDARADPHQGAKVQDRSVHDPIDR